MVTVVNFDDSRILFDKGSSYDIIYTKLFNKLGLRREVLSSYMRTDL